MVKISGLSAVFIHPDLGIGGAERLMLDLAIALRDQGIQVRFITNHLDKTHCFEELKATGDSSAIPVQVIGDWIPRSTLGRFQALWAYIRMLYLTLVHVLTCFDRGDVYYVDQIPTAIPVLKLFRVKNIVYYCHHPDLLASDKGGVLKRFYRKPIDIFEEYGTGKADVILVNSLYTSKIFKQTFTSLGNISTFVLYPTIANSYIQRLAKRGKKTKIQKICPELQGISDEQFVFLSINRFHPAKDLELAINALGELRSLLSADHFAKVHLIIAGGFDLENNVNAVYFRKLVEATHRKDLIVKVTFLKSPTEAAKTELLQSCHCLLYTPSNEHFGIVPLEAMAASKPVIACNSGGPKETVLPAETGFLCDSNGPSMAKAMKKMLEDKENVEQMGLKGLKRLNNKFAYKAFCDRAVKFFFRALYKDTPDLVPSVYKD